MSNHCDCGNNCDRDLNAALNLDKYGLDILQPDPKRTQERCKTTDLPVADLVMA